MTKSNLPPIHPGEILSQEFMKPLSMTSYQLAKEINVSHSYISEIIHGKKPITADIAIKLGQYFKMEAQFWLNLQRDSDSS